MVRLILSFLLPLFYDDEMMRAMVGLFHISVIYGTYINFLAFFSFQTPMPQLLQWQNLLETAELP